jgi:hypothetical protein
MNNLDKSIKAWFNAKFEPQKATFSFKSYTNSAKSEILEINIENENMLGLILIYYDGFLNIDFHDKKTADPILVESSTYNSFEELINKLELQFSMYWREIF